MAVNPIYTISLFKTSLDPSYNNVYGGLSNGVTYLNYLKNLPTFREINMPSARFVKERNGNLIISLPVPYSYFQSYGANYMAVSSAYDTPRFYFITGIESLNTGDNPSTNVYVEYDAWANNLDKLYMYNVPFKLTKGTITTWYGVNDNLYVSNNFGTKEVKTKYTINPYARLPISVGAPEPLFAIPKVLWAKLTLDTTDLYHKESLDSAYAKSTNVGVLGAANQLPVIYAPVAVFNPDGMDLDTSLGENAAYTISGFVDRTRSIAIPISNLNFKIDGLHVIDASLTFYPPFKVNYDEDLHQFIVDVKFNFSYVATKDNNDYRQPISTASPLNPTIYYGVAVYSKEMDYTINWQESLTFREKIYVNKKVNFTGGNGLTDEQVINSSASLKIPYNNYLSLKITGSEYNIIPPANCHYYKINIKHVQESSYIFVEYYTQSDLLIYKSGYIKIDEVGALPITADSTSVYMRNNGNSIAAKSYEVSTKGYMKFASAIPQAVGAVASANVMGAANTALSIATTAVDTQLALNAIDAKLKDVDNQRDQIVSIDSNALKNVFRNQVLLYEIKPDNDDNSTIKCAYDELYYGVVCNKYAPFNGKYKAFFDFKQFESVSLPVIGNINDRNKLESAFRRGVTIWYIANCILVDSGKIMLELRKNIANEEVS